MRTITELRAQALAGSGGAEAVVTHALDRALDPAGEGARAFIRLHVDAALHVARSLDRVRKFGGEAGPLHGLPIAIKDLFDVAGEPTTAGSRVLAGAPAASADAAVVTRLRTAGAVLVGRTNMTEFAFSGVGINPHYGTPANPFDRAARRIPGGSSSGAAVALADGMAAASVGTDTGGSVRIPAALCGLVGFKPTAERVPLAGTLPLSRTLDSVGPIAHSVACCAHLDAVLAGEEPPPLASAPLSRAVLGVPRTLVQDEMEPVVARAFEAALSRLSAAGARLIEIEMPAFAGVVEANRQGGFTAAEAYAWHRALLARRADGYDPRVRGRILRGAEMSAADYLDLFDRRRALIGECEAATAPFAALVMPTVPMVAPRIDALLADAEFFRTNALLLRNPALVNFLDGCAISLPCHEPGTAPVGLMLTGRHGADRGLLALAAAVEAALSVSSKRI